MLRIVYTLFLIIASLNIHAYDSQKTIGIGTGHTWTQAVFNDEIRVLGTTQETPSYSSVSNRQIPWRIFYANRWHQHYGIELGIINFGSIQFDKTLTTVDTSKNQTVSSSVRHANIETQGYYLQHIFEYPISHSIKVNLKAGILFGDTHYSETETLTVNNEETGTNTILQLNQSSDNLISLYVSSGFNYFLSDSLSVSMHISQIKIEHAAEKEDLTQWFTNASVGYHF